MRRIDKGSKRSLFHIFGEQGLFLVYFLKPNLADRYGSRTHERVTSRPQHHRKVRVEEGEARAKRV